MRARKIQGVPRALGRTLAAAALAAIALFAPQAGASESRADSSRDMPSIREAAGVHAIRRFQFQHYDDGARHHLPLRYVSEAPAQQERKGPMEHLLIGFVSSLNSQYVSKELPDSKGPVWQPSATVELYGLGLNVWSNFVLNDEANQGQFNEVDFTTYYTAHIGKLTIHPYFTFMVFPNGDPASLDYTPAPVIEGDIYVQYNLGDFDLFGRMRARIKQTSGQVYANAGAGYGHLFPCGMTLLASVLINMGNEQYLSAQYGPTETNIDAAAFMLGASWKVGGVTFRPNVNLAVHVIPEIRRSIRQNTDLDTYLVWGGMDIMYDF